MHVSPSASLVSSTFKVGKATVRARFDGRDLHFEWDPQMPVRGRDQLMLQAANLLGRGKILDLEIWQ